MIRAGAEMAQPLLSIRDLSIAYDAPVLRGASIEVAPGEIIGLVGESGSGKSQAMLAALGLLGPNAKISGSIRFHGEELLGASEGKLNRLRGRRIAMIFQEPMSSLDPLYSIGRQIIDVLRRHGGLSARAARTRAIELLDEVGIQNPAQRADAYPHEFSGGQRQRVMIAMAIANRPDLIIADEPTTALDVTVQAQILELLTDLKRRLGVALIFISHDLGVIARMASRVYVLDKGAIVESGQTAKVLAHPSAAATRALIDANPAGARGAAPAPGAVIFEARDISVRFELARGLFATSMPLQAVNNVSFRLWRGRTLGVVGESGSGKSTLARAILALIPASGGLSFGGQDLRTLDANALRKLRRSMQIIFQDPFGSLSPRMSIGAIVAEGLLAHAPELDARQREAAAAAALEAVGLDPALRGRTPGEFSGGQRQRIAIARALALRPELLVLDEPTSALDRSVQKGVLALLGALQRQYGMSYLFISHDLAVIRAMADDVLVMKDGAIIERGECAKIFSAPEQAYTRQLIAAAEFSLRV